MVAPSFYEDLKYCEPCGSYVPYLRSLERSYCALCGGRVRLFSEEDGRDFRRAVRLEVLWDRFPREGREPA